MCLHASIYARGLAFFCAQATLARQNHGGGVTGDDGVAEIRVAFTAAADGLYRLRFTCMGKTSIESPPILVVMMGKSIEIVNQLEGIEPAGTRPTRRITMFDLQAVSTTVEQVRYFSVAHTWSVVLFFRVSIWEGGSRL